MARNEDRQSGGAVSAAQDGGLGGTIADLSLAIGRMSDHMKRDPGPTVPVTACHPVWFTGQIALSGSAGTLQQADLYGPKDPYWWDVRSVRTWGFTAGTVTIYRNSTNGEQLGVAPTAGEFTWSSQNFLAPRDQMIFVASGITGTVNIAGWAVQVEYAWLGDYLM